MRREFGPIGISLLFLVVGFTAVWVAKDKLGVNDTVLFASAFFAPVLIYVIASGRLTEFKGPGGVEAKFAEAAQASINVASEKVEPSTQEMQVVVKESMNALERMRQELTEGRPIVMTLKRAERDYSDRYDREHVLNYIEMLSQFRNFKFVVILGEDDRVIAFMPSWVLKGLLSKPMLGEEFIHAINGSMHQTVFSFPGVIRKTISTQSTNAEALREMTQQNLEALVVTDDAGKLKGVVEREQVISRMLLALTA